MTTNTRELLTLLLEDGSLEERQLGFGEADALFDGELFALEPFGPLSLLALVRLIEHCHLSGRPGRR